MILFTAVLAMALNVAVVTLVLSRSKLFAPLREWLYAGEGGLRGFFGSLLGCTFCTSIWLAAAAWGGLVLLGAAGRSTFLFINPLTIAGLAAPMIWAIFRSHGGKS